MKNIIINIIISVIVYLFFGFQGVYAATGNPMFEIVNHKCEFGREAVYYEGVVPYASTIWIHRLINGSWVQVREFTHIPSLITGRGYSGIDRYDNRPTSNVTYRLTYRDPNTGKVSQWQYVENSICNPSSPTPSGPLTCSADSVTSSCTNFTQRNVLTWVKSGSANGFKIQVLTGSNWETISNTINASEISFSDFSQPTVNQTYRIIGIDTNGNDIVCDKELNAVAQKCSEDFVESSSCGLTPTSRILKGLFMSPVIDFESQ